MYGADRQGRNPALSVLGREGGTLWIIVESAHLRDCVFSGISTEYQIKGSFRVCGEGDGERRWGG